jgi:hypothetical protein
MKHIFTFRNLFTVSKQVLNGTLHLTVDLWVIWHNFLFRSGKVIKSFGEIGGCSEIEKQWNKPEGRRTKHIEQVMFVSAFTSI